MRRPVILVAALVAAGATLVALRRRLLRLGATDTEVDAPLPGDELLPAADLQATRAITIEAPPHDVWPWIVQMGQGRGGLYSYDRLENLVGCDIHSADRIVPAWQGVAVGEPFRLHPTVALEVAAVERGRVLVVSGAMEAAAAPPYDFTWAFVLEAGPGGTTRLVVRERYAYRTRWAPALAEPIEAISSLMTERMLRGIRDRAERAAPATAEAA